MGDARHDVRASVVWRDVQHRAVRSSIACVCTRNGIVARHAFVLDVMAGPLYEGVVLLVVHDARIGDEAESRASMVGTRSAAVHTHRELGLHGGHTFPQEAGMPRG